MYPGSKLLVVAATIVLALAAHACGGSEPDAARTPLPSTLTPTSTPVDLQAILRESGRVMEDLRSFHFKLSHRSGNTPLMANMVVDELEGDVVNPDKLAVEFIGFPEQTFLYQSV